MGVILEALGERLEVGEVQLARCGAEERVLLANWFEGGDVDRRECES